MNSLFSLTPLHALVNMLLIFHISSVISDFSLPKSTCWVYFPDLHVLCSCYAVVDTEILFDNRVIVTSVFLLEKTIVPMLSLYLLS